MSEETRKEKEERWLAEYDAYVADCKVKKVGPTGFLNWSFGQKLKDKGPEYVAALMKKIADDKLKEKKP